MGDEHSNLEFRKIPSLDYMYEISEDGRYIRNVKSKKYLKQVLDYHHAPAGYWVCFIFFKGITRRCFVHQLVAECWLGKRPPGMHIDHKDRNTQNNHYTNLRYATVSENMLNRVFAKRAEVILSGPESIMFFDSKNSASRWLHEKLGCQLETARLKLKNHRRNVLGHDVFYPECRD